MSAPMFAQDVLFFQRFMSCAGVYKGKLDGSYGPITHAAELALDRLHSDIAVAHGRFDPRSEAIISTLLPMAQIAARKFMGIAKSAPFTVKLLSGTRTYAEQDALFRKVPRVTKARGGSSNHNFGIAWDVGIFVGGVYYTGRNSQEDKAYSDLAALVKPKIPELEWGGDWTSFKDAPHYQLATGRPVSQVRALFESGQPYV